MMPQPDRRKYKIIDFEIRKFNKINYLVKDNDVFQYEISDIGVEILQLLAEGKDEDHIIKIFSLEYDINNEVLERDIGDFISVLLKNKILQII